MKKRLVCVLVCLTLFAALCGCSKQITEGEVYKKEYKEACTTTTFLPLVISNGKTTTTIMMPYVIRYPDRYVVYIKAYKDNQWKTEEFYVSEEVYYSVKIGEMFSYDEGRGDLKDEPYTKERAE